MEESVRKMVEGGMGGGMKGEGG
jgi:hypothetical protein